MAFPELIMIHNVFLAIESESKTGLQSAKRHTDMIAAASTNTIANPNAALTRNRPQVHQSSGEGVHGFGVLPNFPAVYEVEQRNQPKEEGIFDIFYKEVPPNRI